MTVTIDGLIMKLLTMWKRRIIIGIILIFAILFSFYWFQLRPSFAKKECNESAIKKVGHAYGKYYDWEYASCMRKKGI